MSESAKKDFRVILEGGQDEIVEKKSRFIATVRPVSSEEEAFAFIQEMKKKYWDARHNCSAFVIGDRQEMTRCSDDGEPAGTAGRPMLDLLLKEGITNVAVVVTRYFGGILLGTGGLVRAYQGAVQAGLAASVIIEKQKGASLSVLIDYSDLGKIQYTLTQQQAVILDTEYGTDVTIRIMVPTGEQAAMEKLLMEQTQGTVILEWGETVNYGVVGKKVIFL